MFRRALYLLLLTPLLVAGCRKKTAENSRCMVYARYSGEEEYISIEETYGNWQDGSLSLMAEGLDHEQLKLYVPAISQTGTQTLSTENIAFSDGLDFESQKVLEGQLVITAVSEEEVSGDFRALFYDDINGTEQRWVEGSFSISRR